MTTQPTKVDYDVIVIGGGPSGSSAARQAALNGLSVLLLEKQKMPRRKPCGGALSEQAISYLDFELPSHLIEAECFGARVHYSTEIAEQKVNERIAIMVSRAKFDKYLVDMAMEAGVEIIFDPALSLKVQDSYAVAKTPKRQYSARVIVIASGINKRLQSYVREPDNANKEGICFEANVPVGSSDVFDDLKEVIDIHFGIAQYGYGWLFHHGGYYSVGIGGLRSKLNNPRNVMQKFLVSLDISANQRSIIGHTIPMGGIRRTLVDSHLILVGDAAGFVDPFYGEGLAYAICSGQLAARSILKAFESGDFTKEYLQNYSQRCKLEFTDNLRYSYYLAKILHLYPSLLLSLLAADQNVLAHFLNIPLRRTSYKQFLMWLFPRLPILVTRSFVG